MDALLIAGIAVALVVAAIVLVWVLKRILVNTVLGVIAILAINLLGKPYGLELALSPINLIITAIFGLAGVGGLLLLKLLFNVALK